MSEIDLNEADSTNLFVCVLFLGKEKLLRFFELLPSPTPTNCNNFKPVPSLA